MPTKTGISRQTAEAFGDVVLSPGGLVLASGIITSAARDDGSTPTTYLRAGLVLSKLPTGLWKEFGENFTTVTNEATGAGNGTEKTFNLGKARVVPWSLTVSVGGTAQAASAYEVDWQMGVIRFKTAPANLAPIVSSYLHIDLDPTYGYVADGTEVPAGILANPVSLLDDEGNAQNTACQIILGGQIKTSALIVKRTRSLTYATNYLAAHGFFGIPALEY